MKSKNNWNVKASKFSIKTINPIRSIIENLKVDINPNKKLIPLSIGDPSTFGNLVPCDEIVEALTKAVICNKYNGYLPSNGLMEAREAISNYCTRNGEQVEANNVLITSGCSHALDMCICVLSEVGKNILIPKPGFPIYQTLASGYGVQIKFYNLIPEKNFEIDLKHLEEMIDENTVAIVYNNPSNPCGSVFAKQHIENLLKIAEKHYLPIIADEIYEHMVFPGEQFHSIASLTKTVPILTCRGTTKRFLIPGHRLGWIIIQDKQNIFGTQIQKGLQNLAQRILGANSIIQGALSDILNLTPNLFFDNTINLIAKNADFAYERIQKISGLKPIKPQGAMYMMISIDMKSFPKFTNDLTFVETLIREQSVFCLPGKCFDIENFVRIVLTVPKDLLEEALNRLNQFCVKHFVCQKKILLNFKLNNKFNSEFIDEQEDCNKLTYFQNQKLKDHKDVIKPLQARAIEMELQN